MTCAMQMMKPSPVTMQDWRTIFPDFTTLTGSSQFIKKLMAVSLSAITYMRGIFPDRAYGERNLCGIKLKLLTEDSGIEAVNKFIDLIRSCYDAVDKKYLHQLSIGICTDADNRDEVLESYNMTFRYRDDEFSVANKSRSLKLSENDPTVEATFWLLKSIFTISDILSPLPKNAYLTMKLLYNDEITPQDYEPPGFQPSENEKFSFPPDAIKLELGKVSTDLHGYKMYLKTILSKEPLSQLLEESVLNDSQRSRENIETMQHEDDYGMLQTQLESKSDIIEDSLTTKNIDEKVDCPCTCKQDSGTDILQCSACKRKQHAICYGILKPDEEQFEFYCIQCINEIPTRNMQNDLIYTYEGKEQQELCAVRRALVFCATLKQVTVLQLEKGLKCNKQLAKDLIERLEFEGFIRKSGQRYIVNEKKITNSGYREYFPKNENKENMENSQKMKLSQTKLGEIPNMEEGASRKTRSSTTANGQLLPEEQFMDFAIDEEVKKLNLKGPFDSRRNRMSRRRSLKAMTDNDDFEDGSQKQPTKKRCMSTREPITLRE